MFCSTIWYQSEAVRDHVCGVKDSIFGGVHFARVQSGIVKLVVWDQAYLVVREISPSCDGGPPSCR